MPRTTTTKKRVTTKTRPHLPILIAGPKRDYWRENAAAVERFVTKHQLKPELEAPMMIETAGRRGLTIKPKPIPGGIKVAHLHLGEQTYKLDEAQWQAFTAERVEEFRERLTRARSMSFDQIVAIDETLPR